MHTSRLVSLIGFVGTFVACDAVGQRDNGAPPYDRAVAAFMRHDFDAAKREYRAVLDSDTVVNHRREALVALASIAWRLHRDSAEALRILAAPDTARQIQFASAFERARMFYSFDEFRAARVAAGQARTFAGTDDERRGALLASASAMLGPLVEQRLDGKPALVDDSIVTITAELKELVRKSPGLLEPARMLVNAGVLTDDGAAVLEGWRSYYLVQTGDTASGPLSEPRRILTRVLPRWAGAASLSLADRAAIAQALAASRMFTPAAMLVLGGQTATSLDPSAAQTVAYARFIGDVRDVTDEYYRRTAIGEGSKREWERQLRSAAERLWPQLVRSGAAPGFDYDRMPRELDVRFGALVNLGKTAGYEDLHMGHRVVDREETVQQYGNVAKLRFVALDEVVSNGFQTWAWDSRSAHGGWGGKTMIVQVRTEYANDPLTQWQLVSDTAKVRKSARTIVADSISDAARARTQPIGYFASVNSRMSRDERSRLRDSLVASVLTAQDVEMQFKRLISDAVQESSIFAHEGRHAIDDVLGGKQSNEELEFRAKLSEVVFAPRPRFSLSGIMHANAGDSSPHGKANLRILKALDAWMRAHASEIDRLNRSEAMLPQLPLLTADQLRQAFRSMDPLAR